MSTGETQDVPAEPNARAALAAPVQAGAGVDLPSGVTADAGVRMADVNRQTEWLPDARDELATGFAAPEDIDPKRAHGAALASAPRPWGRRSKHQALGRRRRAKRRHSCWSRSTLTPQVAVARLDAPAFNQREAPPKGDPSEAKAEETVVAKLEDAGTGGQTIAPKGEVTGADKRPDDARPNGLGLEGRRNCAKARSAWPKRSISRSRGEPVRGQIAVAQVVHQPRLLGLLSEHGLRRRLSERAPPSALPVHLRVRRHPRRGARARRHGSAPRRSRAESLGGKLWLPKSARRRTTTPIWVHPSWVREMNKHVQARRSHLLPPAQMGRRLRRAGNGATRKPPRRRAKNL